MGRGMNRIPLPPVLACVLCLPLAESPSIVAAPDPASGVKVAEPPRSWPEPVANSRARRAGLFTLYFENDYFGGTDEHYTNGAKFSWMTPDLTDWGQRGWRRGFLDVLPFVNRPDTEKNFGFSFGQAIYTPHNTDVAVPDPTDRPYAGWSYLELSFISKNTSRADIVSIQAGVVGSNSRAEQTQKTVHRILGDSIPQGWDYQLRNEPGLNLVYERRQRLAARTVGDRLGVDLIPHVGVSLGTVQTYANAGALVRFGFNLPTDFGVALSRGGAIGAAPGDDRDPRVAPDRDASFFVFAAGEGRAVAHDVFLDGNVWKDSPSVKKEPFVADLSAGVGIIAGRWQLTATLVHRTREFETQRDDWSAFGSVTLSVAF